MVPAFIGLEISVPVKDTSHNTVAQLLGKVENIRYTPSLNDKSGFCGKTYVVVLDRLAVGFEGKPEEFVSRYDIFFKRVVMDYLSKNWRADPIDELKYLVFVPNTKGDDERSVKFYIENDITISEQQEVQFNAKARMMLDSFKKKASAYLNEFRRTAKNEDVQAITPTRLYGHEYSAESEVYHGIFQCDYIVDRNCNVPRGGDTLTLPIEHCLAMATLARTGGYGIDGICTLGLDPWPFVVVRLKAKYGRQESEHSKDKFYAIARIDGRFIVRQIKKAESEKQYEMETLLVITEALSKNVT